MPTGLTGAVTQLPFLSGGLNGVAYPESKNLESNIDSHHKPLFNKLFLSVSNKAVEGVEPSLNLKAEGSATEEVYSLPYTIEGAIESLHLAIQKLTSILGGNQAVTSGNTGFGEGNELPVNLNGNYTDDDLVLLEELQALLTNEFADLLELPDTPLAANTVGAELPATPQISSLITAIINGSQNILSQLESRQITPLAFHPSSTGQKSESIVPSAQVASASSQLSPLSTLLEKVEGILRVILNSPLNHASTDKTGTGQPVQLAVSVQESAFSPPAVAGQNVRQIVESLNTIKAEFGAILNNKAAIVADSAVSVEGLPHASRALTGQNQPRTSGLFFGASASAIPSVEPVINYQALIGRAISFTPDSTVSSDSALRAINGGLPAGGPELFTSSLYSSNGTVNNLSGNTSSQGANSTVAAFVTQLNLPINNMQWGNQFAQRMASIVGQGVRLAEIQLNPAEFGPMHVRIESAESSARVAFTTAHPAAREVLDTHLHRLKDMFSDQGLDLVDVESHAFSEQDSGFSGKEQASQQGFGHGDSIDDQSSTQHGRSVENPGEEAASLRHLTVTYYGVVDAYA